MRLLRRGVVALPMISFEPLELVGDTRAGGEGSQGERYEEQYSGLHCRQ